MHHGGTENAEKRTIHEIGSEEMGRWKNYD
jgi:hypothetical protein